MQTDELCPIVEGEVNVHVNVHVNVDVNADAHVNVNEIHLSHRRG